ncbi:hypothetical protein QBC39DRAFT_365061 [Podospora conica]|nr:hypothetical protein QBC39DRAFT_365061 [Schizothecium conicum]
MRHENGAGRETVHGWAQFSGVLKAGGLFDACFGGLTVALRPSCWSKLRLGGINSLVWPQPTTSRPLRSGDESGRRWCYPTPGISKDLGLYNGWHQRPGGLSSCFPSQSHRQGNLYLSISRQPVGTIAKAWRILDPFTIARLQYHPTVHCPSPPTVSSSASDIPEALDLPDVHPPSHPATPSRLEFPQGFAILSKTFPPLRLKSSTRLIQRPVFPGCHSRIRGLVPPRQHNRPSLPLLSSC